MRNLYFNSIVKNLKLLAFVLFISSGIYNTADAQVRKTFTQRTSQYTPTKKIYNVKGDFTIMGNTSLTPQNYSPTTNNNGQFMTYVDVDNDPNTFNSSSSTLEMSTENGAVPSCSNIVYAGLYWTGASSPNSTFSVTKTVPIGLQTVNNNLNIVHNQNIASTSPIYSTNYTLSVTRGGSNNNYYPIYTFSGNGNTYAFSFLNSGTNIVTLSVNGGTATNIAATITGSNSVATLTTPYTITDGTTIIKILKLNRNANTNLSSSNTQSSSNADVNVSGSAIVSNSVTKSFDRRIVKIKGPNAGSYTQITANTSDIYYPAAGIDDNIYTGYAEITDYVRTNGLGAYTVADLALLEGDPGGTGYSGGWGIIVVYENSKMKWRNVTIFDGYAYVNSSNTSGFDLPVSGFSSVQTGNVGVKLGVMASEGDISFTGDYFRIQNLNTTNYTTLNHSLNSATNFFNSSINSGGARIPQLANNTGIDIATIVVPNTGNTIIGNNQTATNFKYGTSGDTYSIFTIAMSVDAYIPEPEGILTATAINGSPAVQPYSLIPGQEATFGVDIKNLGTEAINNFKVIVPIPFNATYVTGSASGSIFNPQTTPTPNSITFNPTLGATGSIVWDFGTLILPVNPASLLARLTFKLKATTDCTILNNTSCGSGIIVNGSTSGIGATTGITFSGTKLIQGYSQNGSCIGQPIPEALSIAIDGASYVQQNCANTPTIRNFSFCSTNSSVGTSEIASYFPTGSLFYNQYPVTINTIQYTDANPIPLVAGSTSTYYAVPPSTISGCNFPFTIYKCPTIVAQNDTINGGNGTTGNSNVGNVLNNNGNGTDTVNSSPATIAQVAISIIIPATSINGNPFPVINTTTGQISVPPGTPDGIYTITYQICDINNSTNCSSATVTITVTKPIIDAVNDNGSPIVGSSGGQALPNVLVNDTLNGNPATLATVNLTQVSTTNPGVTLNPVDGSVNVAPGTPSGSYVVTYQICEKLNPTNCDQATVTVSVTNAVIDAVNDNGSPIVGAFGGQALPNVLVNDTLNGNPATLATVNLTQVSTTNPGVTLNPVDGSVNIAPGTPSGSYVVTYQICEKLNPTNCDQATVTVSVTNAVIDAVNDNGSPIVGASGGQALPNVLVNDTLNGNPATLATVNLTQVSTTNPGVTLNPVDGSVNIAPGTPSGSYVVTYQICEKLNPTNCDQATVTVSVTNSVIDAVNDTITNIVCPTTGIIANILSNDTLNNVLTSINDINLTLISGNYPFVSIDNTGNIVINSGATCGEYTFTYQICEKLNTNNCDIATVNISIIDTTAPVIAALPSTSTISCPASPEFAQASATDECGSAFELTFTDVTTNGACAGSYSVTRTWTATDACGNSSTASQTINVQDTTAPVIAALPSTSTISCPASPEFAQASATDECGSAFELTFTDVTTNGACAGSYSVTRTWTATDACGNSSTASQTINVQDTTAPVIAALPSTSTISCPASPEFAQASATDECGSAFELTFTDVTTNGACAGSYSVTRTWTATDACGNSSTASQTINVQDTTAPVIAALPSTSTISCPASPEFAQASAIDECGSAFELTFTDVTTNGACAGSYSVTRTWTATDACGNSSTASQTINVQDTTAPVIAALPSTSTISCPASPEFAQASATDECGSAFELTFTDVTTNGACAGSYSVTRTWTATDACGNSSTASQTINVQDTTAPVIAALPSTSTISCPASPEFAQASATDECGSAFELTFTDVTTNGACAGSYSVTRTWTATDACGNSSTASQTINVQDTTAPVIAALPSTSTISCPASPEFAQASATDECGSAFELTFTDVTTNGACAGSYSVTRTWTATDACGNSSTASQTLNVQDTTAPVIAALPSTSTISCPASPEFAQASATDECGSAFELTFTDVTTNGACAGSYSVTRTWTATDACGNSSTASQTLNVQDTTAPVIAALPSTSTISCPASPEFAQASATDECGSAFELTFTDVTTNGACAGSYSVTRTWTATDACGNSSTASQTINVQDTTAPVIAALPSTSTISCPASPEFAQASATDECGSAFELTFTDVTTNGACAGSYSVTRTWTATDACGNSSTASQTINVQDTTAPVIAALPSTSTISCPASPEFAQASAIDECGSAFELTFTDVTTNGACAGSYSVTRTWTATDACGNSSTASQTINVQDTTAPVIAALPSTSTISCPASPEFAQASATDECGSAFELTFTDVTTNGACAGSYSVTRTWTATDACGNSSTASQTINVQDTTAPVIAALPSTSTISCPASPEFAQASATDECGSAFELTFTDVTTNGACAGSYSVTRTWTATDACGNSSTASQTINVQDTTAPVINIQASNIVVECDGNGNELALYTWLSNNGGASATDECSNVTWTNNLSELSNDCSTAVTIIFTATDECGNTSNTSATFTIHDTQNPTAPQAPATVTVACAGDVPAMTSLTALDNCSGEITVEGVDATTQGNCANSFTIVRTWTFTDACGNSSSIAQTINVIDDVAPVAPQAPATVTVACVGDVPAMTSLTALDNCAGEITVEGVDATTQGNCANSFTIVRTWTFTDACGNSSSVAQTINVIDDVAPVAPQAPATVTVACAGDVPAMTSLTALDNCSGEITVEGVDATTQGNCANSFTIVRTWTFTDACGNSSSVAQTINVIDDVAPVAPQAPATVTVACAGDVPAMTSLTALDNCAGEITVEGVDATTQGNCANSFTIVRTWTFTDACGNSSSVAQTINVIDDVAPVAPQAPATVTVACVGDVPAMTSLTALDNCAGEITVEGVDATTQGNCANSFTIVRTWTFTDACGNSSSVAQTINVIDDVAPVAPQAPATVTVACAGDVPAMTSLTALDNCAGEITVEGVDATTQGNCANSFTIVRTWTFTDACGNSSSVAQTINVIDDVAPVAPQAPATVTVACAGDVPAMTSLTALDNCSGEITVEGVDATTQGNCANSFTIVRTWTFTDACGNSSSIAQTINVIDDVAPVAPQAPATVTVACVGDVPAMTSLTALDNCAGEITVEGVDATTQGNCANSFTIVRTWTFTDACGNSSSVAQTINVIDDVAPVAPQAPATVTVACAGDVPAMTSLTALDNCSGEITVEGVDATTQGNCANSFTIVRTWTFTDACGNSSSVAQTINVIDDVAPVAPQAPATVTVACAGDVPAMTSLTALDNCAGEITVEGVDATTQGNCANSFTIVRTWTFTDACGNSSSVAQTINVIDDVAPVAPQAPATVTVACAGDVPAMTSLTALDNCAGEITVEGVDATTQGNCANSFTIVRTWTFTDACGNSSSVAQTINVIDDVAPVAPQAPATVTVACAGDVPAMTSLTALDNCSGEITVEGVDATTQGNCANSFTIVRTWTFTDACGNSSSVAQTINVIDDVAPVAPQAPATVTVACAGDVPAMTSLTALDNCAGEITVEGVDATTQGNCANSFTIVRTWTFTDACGNSSSVAQTINVIDDVAPVAPQAPATVTVACAGDVPAMTSLTALDNCAGEITVEGVDATTQGNCANSFTIVRTWTFTDACGNSSSVAQTINVIDDVAPTFNQVAPENTTASCDNIPAPAVLTATDNCGNATVSISETIIQGNCPSNYQIVRTWTASDACNNTTSVTQTIGVSDTTGPVLVTPLPNKVDATCDAIPSVPILEFTDNCSAVGTPIFTETTSEIVDNVFTITRTWVVSDACGNLSQTYTQYVFVTTPEATIKEATSCTREDFAYDLRSLLDNPDDVPAGAVWENINSVGGFNGTTFNAFGIAEGIYTFSYNITSGNCPRRIDIVMTVNSDCGPLPCESIVIHNAFTPNGDAFNQFFNIEHIEDTGCYPTNKVEIYNRWGVLVYETKNYDNNTRRFEGISEGRATVSKSSELPTGTYFYIIEWTTTDGAKVTKDGYLYLTR